MSSTFPHNSVISNYSTSNYDTIYTDSTSDGYNTKYYESTDYYEQLILKLNNKIREHEFTISDLNYKVSRCNDEIQNQVEKLKLFIEAANLLIDKDTLQKTVNNLITAKKNEKIFNDLLETGLNELK